MKFIKQISIFVYQSCNKVFNSLRSVTQSNRFHRTNALSPLLWIIGILAPFCAYSAFAAKDPIIVYVSLGLLGLVVLYTLRKYGYLLKNDPDRLHSEDYLAEIKRLDIIASKGEVPQSTSGIPTEEPKKITE